MQLACRHDERPGESYEALDGKNPQPMTSLSTDLHVSSPMHSKMIISNNAYQHNFLQPGEAPPVMELFGESLPA